MSLSHLVVVVLGVLVLADPVSAEFSPETVAKRKKAATDVLRVEVVGVRVDRGATDRRTLVTARVVGVERGGDPSVRGTLIKINSCPLANTEVDESNKVGDSAEKLFELADGIVGPAAPPRIEVGWRGTVYLNSRDRDDRVYDLAVHGHSYVPERNGSAK